MQNIKLLTNPILEPPCVPGSMPVTIATKNQKFNVTFSAEFENEAESLKFASLLISLVTGDSE